MQNMSSTIRLVCLTRELVKRHANLSVFSGMEALTLGEGYNIGE
jgi:hypothetical protein